MFPLYESKHNLVILYEDDAILVLYKPSGLLTQAPRGIDSLEHRVKAYLAAHYLGVPHRLDRPTSGVIIFGKTHSATHRLSQQFEARTIDKCYWAWCEGVVPEPAGTWRDFLRKLPDIARAEVIQPIHPDAREAVLHFTVIWRTDEATLLEIRLDTGRMHQIRVQAASRGFPIIGDTLYGSARPFGTPTDDPRNAAVALHACSLTVMHPKTREPLTFTATAPDTFPSVVE